MLDDFSTRDSGLNLSAHAVLPHLADSDSTIKSYTDSALGLGLKYL